MTLIGIAVASLDDGDAVQLALPLDGGALGGARRTLDTARDRFGGRALTRASLLGPSRAGDADPAGPTTGTVTRWQRLWMPRTAVSDVLRRSASRSG